MRSPRVFYPLDMQKTPKNRAPFLTVVNRWPLGGCSASGDRFLSLQKPAGFFAKTRRQERGALPPGFLQFGIPYARWR